MFNFDKWKVDSKTSYQGTNKIIKRYWERYGGCWALITSPYFHASILVSLVSANAWINEGWQEIVINVMPNLLGFSLGGYAIFLAFTDHKFLSILKKDGNDDSPYMVVNASFAHFIVVQVLALLYALVSSSLVWAHVYILSEILSFVGYTIFIYSLFSALASVFALLRLASWYNTQKHE